MSESDLRNALSLLQADPESEDAWSKLASSLSDLPPSAKVRDLLVAARHAHESRREFDAVARLLAYEVELAKGTPEEAKRVEELARVLDMEVLDEPGAARAWVRLLELSPGHAEAAEALSRGEVKRSKWTELVTRYRDEAKSAGDSSLRASLLVSAAEVAYRYGKPSLDGTVGKAQPKKLEALLQKVTGELNKALEQDPKNRRAMTLLERVHRHFGDFKAVAATLEKSAAEAPGRDEKVASLLRLGRLYKYKLDDTKQAASAYERVLDLSPGHQEATSALVDHFTASEEWDRLAALYEEQLSSGQLPEGQETGFLVQVAMIHWRFRNAPEAAEPYFERLRKLQPGHPGVVDFFREWCKKREENARFAQVLTEAVRAMPDGAGKNTLAAELAGMAEEGASTAKAVEQWKGVLRHDPNNKQAREALKRLYRQTAQVAPLADVIRGELERTPADAKEARLPLLRELAQIYREQLKNDAALVTVLMQITNFDPSDVAALRDLARVYEALGRFRDLLTVQMKLAEVETATGTKAELYRSVGQRWLDQFSNVQNAVEAFEKLLQVLPGDPEAVAKLKELYLKRRAYKPLFDLYAAEAERANPGPERRASLLEMAKLAAERLDRGSEAITLYRQILAEDPSDAGAMDALEKLAERDKDYKALAEVLEIRVDQRGDTAAKLQTLQKLGVVYSDRLGNPEGAMRTWRRVLELSPGNAKAVRVLRDTYLAANDFDQLAEMYGQSSDWEGLAEVLSSAADKATDPSVKVDLSFRAAEVYAHRIGAPERGFRAYERVLGVKPDDERAASALVPIYEKEEKWARLPALYEVLLAHAKTDDDKLALLDKLAKVTGAHLADRGAAFNYARRAYALDRTREGALDRLEAGARAAGDFEGLANVLRGEVEKSEGQHRRALKKKLADIYANELERVDDAIAQYQELVDEDPSDDAAVETLDRALRSANKKDELRKLFEVRIERAEGEKQLSLLREWATLEEEVFESPEKAIALHRRVLEVDKNDGPSLRALARLLRTSGDAAGAIEALTAERDRSEGMDRARLEVEIARLELGSLNHPEAALAAAERALEIAPKDAGAKKVVEELLSAGKTRAQAATVLERIYGAENNYEKQTEMLEVLVATARAREDRLDLYQRLVDVRERKMNDVAAAYDTVVRAVEEFPGELELWDRLGVLANKSRRTKAFVAALVAALPENEAARMPAAVEIDLAERLATLLVESIGDANAAKPYLRRILAKDPTHERAFTRLKQILTTQEEWAGIEELYENTVAATPDPEQQATLLAEVAVVAEEITQDREKAIGYYRRILALSPDHEQAIKSLTSLYVAQGHWHALSQLLEARLAKADGEEALALKQRIGVLAFDKLNQPERALTILEEVLGADPLAEAAREVVEKCLSLSGLRPRAASVLEQVYVAQDSARDLVRILEIRLETATDPVEHRELLRRIAELRDERLGEGAFDAFARLVPVAPDDNRARERLLELAQRVGAYDETARVLTEAAKNAESPQPRATILSLVAKIYEDNLDQPAQAAGIYQQVLEIDPNDAELALPAARALERIHAGSGDNAALLRVLRVQVKLEDDSNVRRTLHGRIGILAENMLDDPRGAIEAWRTRLEEDPVDDEALQSLDRLYERAGEWRSLVDILRTRERRAENDATRRTLMERIAATLGDRLGDVPEAILAYRALVDELGPERPWLQALEGLYEKEGKNAELGETLEAELGRAETNEDKLAVLTRLGSVRQSRLDDLSGALEAYRQALEIDPRHTPSRDALEGLLASENGRRDAAMILKPLYEQEGDAARLLRALDIEAEYEESPDGKLAIYAHAERVAEDVLADLGRAFGYATRALPLAAESDLGTWLAIGDRLAERTGRMAEYVEILRNVLPNVPDEDKAMELALKIADLARNKLQDTAIARQFYVRALEMRGDEARALEALETLYEESGEHAALLDILKRRVENVSDDTTKKRLLFKEARLLEDTIKDGPAAVDVYQAIVDIAPDQEAYTALERLLAAQKRHDDLVALYERQIGLGAAADKRAALHHQLGRVLEVDLVDFDRAYDQYEQALRLDAQHPATVATLENLMARPEHAFRAATILEDVYLARLDWRKVMQTIEARLAVCEDAVERAELLRRLAKLHEEQEENYGAALETTAKLLAENITDEDTWEELERLSRVANAEQRLAEIYANELAKKTEDDVTTAKLAMRTGEIFERLRDPERALALYRRAYAFDPETPQAFGAIDRMLVELARPADRVAHFKSALDNQNDPSQRLETLHRIATLQEDSLHDDAGAIETHRAALDVEDTDTTALDSLARLYRRANRWSDLAELFRKRAEMSAAPEEEAAFRFELGRVLEENIGDVPAAIGEYQAIHEVAPTSSHAEGAVRALERLLEKPEHKARIVGILSPIYESSADWKRLVSIANEKLRIADTDSERVTVLRETARLWEDQGNEPGRAFDAMKEAFALDPEDGETRGELDRLAELTKRWDSLALAYEAGIERSEGLTKKELLGALARLHDQRRDDPRRALDAWARLFTLDESDMEPLEQMDALATLLSDWTVLVRVLAKRAEMVGDDEERATLWRRVGEARRDMLEDPNGAIEAYERALELEPESAYTLDNLIPLYEAKDDSAKLVELYRRRVDLCGEDDEGMKFQLLLDAANRYETGLNDRREAIAQLAAASAVKPEDQDVIRRLGDLYAAEKMWPELLENLTLRAANATDADSRMGLKKRMAALLANELDDGPAAVDAYREILQGGFDAQAHDALRELARRHEDLRADIVDVLEPVLRQSGRNADLLDALAMRLESQSDPSDRTRTLREIAALAAGPAADLERAEKALLRAMAEDPTDAEVHRDLESVSERIGNAGWRHYADALSERAAASLEAPVAAELYSRLGAIAESKLDETDRAARAYAAAAEQGGDNEAVLAALDRLYGRLGDGRALAGILERRVSLENEPAKQVEILHRLGTLQRETFKDAALALATFRAALDRVPEHDASRIALESLLDDNDLFTEVAEALESVYRGTGRASDLASLYEKRVERAEGGDRLRMRIELAQVFEQDVKDPARAQRVLESALRDDPADPDVLSEVERLAPITNGWREAETALTDGLGRAESMARSTKAELWGKLATWRRDRLSDPRGAEEALQSAITADPENAELLRQVEDLQRAPGRERELVGTLRARVRFEHDPNERRALLKESKELAEKTLADIPLAETCLRDILADDENDTWALEELARFREAAGDWKGVVDLLTRLSAAEAEADKAAAVRHRLAKTLVERLDDVPRAIKVYEVLVEDQPNDQEAAEQLRKLYTSTGRERDLAELLRKLIDRADSPSARTALRLSLAKLEDKLGERSRASDTYRDILAEEPDHAEAAIGLSGILEKDGRDEELAELMTSQIERAKDRGDVAAELSLQVRLGQMYETRLKDAERALETYDNVLEREPQHEGALRAIARIAEERGDAGRAQRALSTLVDMSSGSAGVELALRLADAGKAQGDIAAEESALRRAIAYDPLARKPRERLRDLLERDGRYADVAELLLDEANVITRANPTVVTAPAPGTETRQSGRPPATSLAPPPLAEPLANVVRLLKAAADVHLKERKEPGDAIPILERAATLQPQDRDLLLLLCDTYSKLSRERDAAMVLERIIASFGARRTKELSVFHHRLGQALHKLGDRDVALEQYDMAFKIDPGSVGVLRDLGVLALENEDLDRAQKSFRALLLQRLDDASGISKGEVFYYLGEISAKQGDRAKAVQMFERAVESDPALDRARARLGEMKSS